LEFLHKEIVLRKTTQLKKYLADSSVTSMLGVHNALSAKIAEEAGCQCLWASGFAMAASLGVRDNNEASWTQIVEICEFMADATEIPLLLDGDSGYGDFNNVRRLIKKIEARGIAGVCIEDKCFPKTNSFINSEQQALADVTEFCGKIRAAKDTQKDSDFVVVARTEAFITGQGLSEALDRANAYVESGADAILVHSKEKTPVEIDAFMQQWKEKTPVVIVPTTYASTPFSHFKDINISLVIWANQLVRAATKAMQEAAGKMLIQDEIVSLEKNIASMGSIFQLQNTGELKQAEARYHPKKIKKVKELV
jgi:phosphoenolpyruvate phosphomutase